MSLQSIEQSVSKKGYRLTDARREVIKVLYEAHGHISADKLYELMQTAGSSVGRMTVFRTLDLLAEIGVIRPTYLGDGAAHYVLLLDGHHHHLVCTSCDKTIEFDDCTITDLAKELSDRHDFSVGGHLIEIYGVCAECKK